MKKPMISHECPIGLLNYVQRWNDYDYCLVHLLETYHEYTKFIKSCVQSGRHVIMDNSIFELGAAFDWSKYRKWINEIQPTEYIVPDVLEDGFETIDSFQKWMDKHHKDLTVNTKTIGVVQGKTFDELVTCYQFMAEHADKIAISFDYSYYLDVIPEGLKKNKWQRYAVGRRELIKTLVNHDIWRFDKPHHLLGCAVPIEMSGYNWQLLNIVSLDTSNPVQQGLLGQVYDKVYGLQEKKDRKVVDDIDRILFSDNEKQIIRHNCNIFRCFCLDGLVDKNKYFYDILLQDDKQS